MILTEEEAKTKLCPQPEFHRCIASECMAWRGQWRRKLDGLLVREGSRDPRDYESVGYCGLAGAP